jgi:hypothetical protein
MATAKTDRGGKVIKASAPRALANELKAQAALEGKTVQEVLLALVRAYVKQRGGK